MCTGHVWFLIVQAVLNVFRKSYFLGKLNNELNNFRLILIG